jgi:hypothetical protein
MTSWDDLENEMRVVALDTNTSDRLLAGALAPADAPPGYAAVAQLLEALSVQPTADELAREAEHVTMVATAVLSSSGTQFSSPTRSFAPFALSRRRIAAFLIVAGLAGTGGTASAGVLPGAAQDIASAILDKVGISVPSSNENAGTHPSVRGASVDRSDGGKGGDISELATTTELTGVDKGATISRVASDGKSRAGQRGSGSTAEAAAPVAAPDAGDTGTTDTTSDETSDDKSSPGRSTADEASGGHSVAGSGNASSGQEKADKAHKSKGS